MGGGGSGTSVALRYYTSEDYRIEPILFQQFGPKKVWSVLCFGGTTAVSVMKRTISWFEILFLLFLSIQGKCRTLPRNMMYTLYLNFHVKVSFLVATWPISGRDSNK